MRKTSGRVSKHMSDYKDILPCLAPPNCRIGDREITSAKDSVIEGSKACLKIK